VRYPGSRQLRTEGFALFVVLAAALAFTYTELSDGDLGFHLATGREVLASGRIPSTNVLSYTNPEHPWLLHQWLPGVLFEWAFRHGGLVALQAIRMVLVGAIWLVVYGAARVTGAAPIAAALATVLCESASAFRFQLRPYLFTHLSLAVTVLCATRFLSAVSASNERTARRSLLGATLTGALASHLHAGVIDSWLVLVALLWACLVERFWHRLLRAGPPTMLRPRHAAWVTISLGLSIGLAAATLALYHPYGARILLFPFDMASDAYLADHLVEFRPPFRFPFSLLSTYWVLVGLCLVALAGQLRQVSSFWPALLFGFLFLSLKHARLAFGFAVVCAPFLAIALEHWLARVRGSLTVAVLALAAPLLVVQRYRFDPPGLGFAPHVFPSYLFDYLEHYHLNGRPYVSDAWAAPLLGRVYPAQRAFFDNRFEAYPRDFFVHVYQHIRYGLEGWDRLLDHYRVQLVLMRYTTPGEAERQAGKPNLRQRLASDPRWTLVTFDDEGELFVRTEGQHREHAARFSLAGLEPDRARFLVAPRARLDALKRELARGNHSARAHVFAAHAAIDAGDLELARSYAEHVLDSEAGAPFVAGLREHLAAARPGTAP
jgi:hypothetical protein